MNRSDIKVASAPEKAVTLEALRENVAAALESSPSHVTVLSWKFSPGMRSLRCWGESLGKRYFAKTLLADPYPLMTRPAIPWRAGSKDIFFRAAGEQIEAEWNTTCEMRKLAGPDTVAAPMGKSLATRTIVWQDAGGERLDDLVKRPRLLDFTSHGLTAALFRAGAWLKKVHGSSSLGSETLQLSEILQALRRQVEEDGQTSSRHAECALRALDSAFRSTGTTSLTVPTVLSHGDFMLANLRWNRINKIDDRLFVVDFENFGPSNQCQDLISLVFDLRSKLLNPLIPKRLLLSLEKSFWAGYGALAGEIRAFVGGVASARVFYYHLPQALQKRSQKGGLASATASVYRTFLEPAMLARCRAAS